MRVPYEMDTEESKAKFNKTEEEYLQRIPDSRKVRRYMPLIMDAKKMGFTHKVILEMLLEAFNFNINERKLRNIIYTEKKIRIRAELKKAGIQLVEQD